MFLHNLLLIFTAILCIQGLTMKCDDKQSTIKEIADNLIDSYKQRLNLHESMFSRIDHEDATVAAVYKVTSHSGESFILKICNRSNDFFNELYFLQYFAGKIPVPRIVRVVQPAIGLPGAILMECLPGALLKESDLTHELAYEIGSVLARIHLNKAAGYGNLAGQQDLSSDPCISFALKFEEGLSECKDHLPQELIERCRAYFNEHINLLSYADGPCIIHRDFRAGNVIVDNGKLQGVIDWSAAKGGFAQEDFCFLEHGGWPMNPNTKQSFLAGYASIRPIPDYDTMMPLLRLSRTIAVIGFTVKRGTWNNRDARIYQYNREFLQDFFKKP